MTADKNRNEKENKKENKRENKRDNTYVRMGFFMAVSAIVGGIVGFLTIMALDGNLENIESGAAVFLAQVQRIMLPLLIAITAYRSSYKAYIQMQNRWIPMLLLITMFGHLLFNTGIMAIVSVSFIYLLLTSSYLRSCVSLKGAKL